MTDDPQLRPIWTDIEAWLQTNAPARAAELPSGAAADAIAGLSDAIGRALPIDYATSLSIHDGGGDLSDYTLLSIEDVAKNWARLNDRAQSGAFDAMSVHNPTAVIIQTHWWDAGWIPFAKDSGGNYLCLDLNPGTNGIAGQVLRFEREAGPGPAGPASFKEWLAEYRDGLQSGAYAADEDGFIQPQ